MDILGTNAHLLHPVVSRRLLAKRTSRRRLHRTTHRDAEAAGAPSGKGCTATKHSRQVVLCAVCDVILTTDGDEMLLFTITVKQKQTCSQRIIVAMYLPTSESLLVVN